MTWNYRVTRQLTDDGNIYAIREVYYRADGTIRAWSADPRDPFGETLDEIKTDLIHMVAAFDRPLVQLNGPGTRARAVKVDS